MASQNSAGEKKRKSSDDLTIAPPAKRGAFEAITMASSPPAESSSSARNHPPYDIFISHYGKDTKHTLASSIYKKLDITGLRVFLDHRELELGDYFPRILEEAIGSASLQIVIFSQNYALSPWCLTELKCMLQTGVTFIPISYHVDPYTPRWASEGKGIYADAFCQYEKKGRYSTEELHSWKKALHKASFYTGVVINNQW